MPLSALHVPRLSTLVTSLLLLGFAKKGDAVDKGGVCDPREFFKEVDNDPTVYIKCSPKVAQVGEWELARCPKNEIFVRNSQKCKPASAVRRQQSLCQLQPYAPGCAQMACQASNANPFMGGACNWATASLVPYPTNPSYFLQCAPAVTGAPCGMWTQMGCASGSLFQPQLQVCVTAALPQASCQQGFTPVCPCGPLNACPGACVCLVGVCCQPAAPISPPIVVLTTPPAPPICPNGFPAISSCSPTQQCPLGFACINSGCCPIPTTVAPPTCPNGTPGGPGSPCVGSGQSSCPEFYECINRACCPLPLPQCPNGQTATQRCSGTGQSTCPSNFFCSNGGCCPLPTCPNGQPATQACGPGNTCPAGFQCQGGGCCPLPLCPNGVPAIQACTGPGTCPNNAFCFNGGCCPIPNCPNGQPATQPCTTTADCPSGFTCQGGGCCPLPLPTCPNGQPATSSCTGPGTCPNGFYCQTGPNGEQGCCPQPNCPNGQPAISPCSATQACPTGYVCQNNGCCPLPVTTTPLPLCPNGQMPLQPCGPGGTCPMNYVCMNGQCCFSPTIAPPPQPCQAACCPAPTCCPVLTVAVCMCAQINMVCPTGSACSGGTCCAPVESPYAAVLKPGDRCVQPTDCPGYPLAGQCNNGYCVCVGNSRSNGYTCSPYRRRYDPAESCNQFGTHCKSYADGQERRKPLSPDESGVGNYTEPMWWQSLSNNCVTDAECTPDMMCISRKCYPHVRPGEYNCQFDEQCNRTCPGSVCVEAPSMNMTVCRCEEGRFEFAHKCWRECPAGSRQKGQACVPQKLEKNSAKSFARRILSLFTPWSKEESLNE